MILLASALVRLLREGRSDLAGAYSETALRRVWRCSHSSWWMTSMLHRHGDDVDARLRLAQPERLCASEAAQRELAESRCVPTVARRHLHRHHPRPAGPHHRTGRSNQPVRVPATNPRRHPRASRP